MPENALSENARPENQPRCLIIFFHSHGATGDAMRTEVAKNMAPDFPAATFVFPDGPIVWGETDPHGPYRSWFDVSDMNEQNIQSPIIAARAFAAAKKMNAEIDHIIAKSGISQDRVILAGFSQGGTMAYYTAMTRPGKAGGVFSQSGGALDQIDLRSTPSKPPVVILAGDQEKHPYSGTPQALHTHALLQKNGFETECRILPDTRHQITSESMQVLAALAHLVIARADAQPKTSNTLPVPPSRFKL